MAYKVKSTERWVAQARDAGGKRIQLGTHATRREALKAEGDHARRLPQCDVTVTEWRARWLSKPEWRESTRAHNTERTAMFAREHGAKRLGMVNRTTARDFLAAHPSAHGALSAMFGAAMYEDDPSGAPLLAANPFAKLVKRTTHRRDLRSEWLTADDIQAIEDTARRILDPRFGEVAAGMVRFAAETGIRPGELFVVTHDCVNPDDGVLLIDRAADSKTRRVGLPKNGERREIVLSARAAGVVQASDTDWRCECGDLNRGHEAFCYRCGAGQPEQDGDDLVFTSPTGKQFWNTSWLYYWHQIRAAAGRPEMDFYELRHYCATRLLEAGLTERDVAEQLGHTDGGDLVRRVYGHPSRRRSLDRVRLALNDKG